MNNPHTESSDSITTHEESARRIDALLRMFETERREVRRLKHEAVDLNLDYRNAIDAVNIHRAAASRLRDERDKALSELEVLRNEDEFKRQLRAGANGDD